MTRIISGKLGSLRLKTAAKATRPTSDRVKESIFSKLEHLDALEGARVLDLFAGTGALGFEAISRGAAELTALEKNRDAFLVLRENQQRIKKLMETHGMDSQIRVLERDARFWNYTRTAEYGLIFLDPPYSEAKLLFKKTEHVVDKALIPGGFLVEFFSTTSEIEVRQNFELVSSSRYGETTVRVYVLAPSNFS